MCQYGNCPNTATTMVTSYESGDDLAVCEDHVHVGAHPGPIDL